jgi:hypothetical protein
MAFSPRLPTFINFRTKGFQFHHKEDFVLHAHAHVAVELSVLAINLYLQLMIVRGQPHDTPLFLRPDFSKDDLKTKCVRTVLPYFKKLFMLAVFYLINNNST